MNTPTRRQFLNTLTLATGASVLLASTANARASGRHTDAQTVGDVINLILKTIPQSPFPRTVDTLKSGELTQPVTGITTTMFATLEVIEKTISAGANFIIAHEPTFYNHLDDTGWLAHDDVYHYKRDLLTKHKIAVWRFHDYWHSHVPDGILAGVLSTLGWEKFSDAGQANLLTLPAATSLGELIQHAKKSLGIATVRLVGDTTQRCQRILLLPGAYGGQRQIDAAIRAKPDVVLCGEVSEWETAEYIRDARYKGNAISLVVLGHALSEEPGMKWLVSWLQPKVKGVAVTHLPSGNPFTFA